MTHLPPLGPAPAVNPLITLNYHATILYYDGAIIIHLLDNQAQNYFLHFIDQDDKRTRYWLYQVSDTEFEQLRQGALSFRDAILNRDTVIILDLDDNENCVGLTEFSDKNYPSDYLPDQDSFLINWMLPPDAN